MSSVRTHCMALLGFSTETEPIECVCVCVEIYFKELVYVIMKAGKYKVFRVGLYAGD